MSTPYPSDALFETSRRLVRSYPEPGRDMAVEHAPIGVEPVPEKRLAGMAFFPGGDGVYRAEGAAERPAFPCGKVMVVGRDFDTRANFDLAVEGEARGTSMGESRDVTWKTLLAVLESAHIPPASCFFTNAFMGLRTGGSNTGEVRWHRNAAFRAECIAFFAHQLDVVRPALILSLGMHVAEFLGECADNLGGNWRAASWEGIDGGDGPLALDVRFKASEHPVAAVAALLHPANRRPNLRWRHYDDRNGEAAEQTLLVHAALASGIHRCSGARDGIFRGGR